MLSDKVTWWAVGYTNNMEDTTTEIGHIWMCDEGHAHYGINNSGDYCPDNIPF